MKKKDAKKLRELAILMTSTGKGDTRKVYRRLKRIHKFNKKGV